MIELYQNEGIITEPAGALALSALDDVAEEIRGKTVVCVLSGGNNDVLRYPEILERSLVFQGRKHYFIIEFAPKPRPAAPVRRCRPRADGRHRPLRVHQEDEQGTRRGAGRDRAEGPGRPR